METTKTRYASLPSLGMGTWKLTGEACADRVCDALEIGYRHVDTAQAYENHAQVGQGLRRASVDREEIFLTTKVWFENLRAGVLQRSVEESLRELDVDYVDLLLIHWPNPKVPLEETLDALLAIQEQGRTRHVGVSNFPPTWLERASNRAPLVCDQVEYHPLLSQQALLETLREREMALVAYSPLAHGKLLDEPVLLEIAEAHERSPAQVALRWLLSQEGVATIPKASSREHLEENFDVFGFDLDEDEQQRLHRLAAREGERTVDPDFAPTWER